MKIIINYYSNLVYIFYRSYPFKIINNLSKLNIHTFIDICYMFNDCESLLELTINDNLEYIKN